MDFIMNLTKTPGNFDTIWVVVNRLMKSAPFIVIRESSSAEQLIDIYVKEAVNRHGVSASLVSDRDTRFTSHFL